MAYTIPFAMLLSFEGALNFSSLMCPRGFVVGVVTVRHVADPNVTSHSCGLLTGPEICFDSPESPECTQTIDIPHAFVPQMAVALKGPHIYLDR